MDLVPWPKAPQAALEKVMALLMDLQSAARHRRRHCRGQIVAWTSSRRRVDEDSAGDMMTTRRTVEMNPGRGTVTSAREVGDQIHRFGLSRDETEGGGSATAAKPSLPKENNRIGVAPSTDRRRKRHSDNSYRPVRLKRRRSPKSKRSARQQTALDCDPRSLRSGRTRQGMGTNCGFTTPCASGPRPWLDLRR